MSSPELYWLTMSTLLTACLWLPYILKLIVEAGLIPALTDGNANRNFDADWASRARKAHANAIENLVVFAPLALMVGFLELGNGLTAKAAMVYFFARVAHYVMFIAGIALLRTLSFAAGWACTVILALRLLNVL